MGLDEALLRGVYVYGFEQPSVIQQHAIKPLMKGRDLLLHANLATGKTAAFTIAMLHRLDYTNPECQALILCPTRELVIPMLNSITAIGKYLKLAAYSCVGGISTNENAETILQAKQVIIGTPDRLSEMIFNHKTLNFKHVKMLIIDEVVELLSRGYKTQIHDIFAALNQNIQVCLSTPTMSSEVLNMADQFMKNPIKIHEKKRVRTKLEGSDRLM